MVGFPNNHGFSYYHHLRKHPGVSSASATAALAVGPRRRITFYNTMLGSQQVEAWEANREVSDAGRAEIRRRECLKKKSGTDFEDL